MTARGRLAVVALLAATSCPSAARAQDDLRDVVTLKQGQPLRGRVFARYEPDVLTLQVGRHRQQVPRADVVALDTVRDRVREFFTLLDRLPDNLKHRWFMVSWATDHELHDLARVAALDVVLRDPDHQDAHLFLGHRRQQRGKWAWPCDDQWLPLAELAKVRADWQNGWRLAGEHVVVQSNADLRRVVDAVLDLERFHLAWFERFGEPMRLYEVVGEKLDVRIWRDTSGFPRLSSADRPYFFHRVLEAAHCATFFAEPNASRPLRLFEIATAHLMYRTIADDPTLRSYYRPATWAEIGLGRVLERSVTGPAGALVLGTWRIDEASARLVLAHPERDLLHVAQIDTKKQLVAVSDVTEFEPIAAELAVAWVLTSPESRTLRPGFFGYLLEVVRGTKGTSSTALARNLGEPQELDKPWRAWIRREIAPPDPAPASGPTRH